MFQLFSLYPCIFCHPFRHVVYVPRFSNILISLFNTFRTFISDVSICSLFFAVSLLDFAECVKTRIISPDYEYVKMKTYSKRKGNREKVDYEGLRLRQKIKRTTPTPWTEEINVHAYPSGRRTQNRNEEGCRSGSNVMVSPRP